MANLEEMRTFQQHWHAYRDECDRLDRLQRNVPIDVSALDPDVRRGLMLTEPDQVVYQIDVVRQAVEAAGGVRVACDPEPVWGWWFAEPSWSGWGSIAESARDLEEERLKLRAIEAQRHAAIEDDEARCKALDAVRAYTTANDGDARSVADLEAQVAQDLAAGEAAEGGFIRRFVRRLRLRATWRRRSEHLERLRREVDERTGRRAKEIERLSAEITSREQELVAPFEEPCAARKQAVDRAEQMLRAALVADLSRRDPSFSADDLADTSFDEALPRMCERTWGLLDAWMDTYRDNLSTAIEHARFRVDSEGVWLEGHDPFGKRYWHVVDDVVALLEAGGARDSDAALAAVLAS